MYYKYKLPKLLDDNFLAIVYYATKFSITQLILYCLSFLLPSSNLVTRSSPLRLWHYSLW